MRLEHYTGLQAMVAIRILEHSLEAFWGTDFYGQGQRREPPVITDGAIGLALRVYSLGNYEIPKNSRKLH